MTTIHSRRLHVHISSYSRRYVHTFSYKRLSVCYANRQTVLTYTQVYFNHRGSAVGFFFSAFTYEFPTLKCKKENEIKQEVKEGTMQTNKLTRP